MHPRSIRPLFLAAALSIVSSFPADALPNCPEAFDAVARAAGRCGDLCVVSGSNGGRVMDFEDAAEAIRRGAREKLVIDGYCVSSCMTMAAFARPRTCITERAVFAYHKTNRNRPIPLSGDLHRWIVARGGFPEVGASPGVMSNEAARRLFALCNGQKSTRNRPSSI